MAYVYSGNNPSALYKNALMNIETYGSTYFPRGKAIKEIRPAIFEFLNPYNRVTFLRKINPFFQLAESWWILSGRADVDWLMQYNSNISQFSDNGDYFNAPYGERMRSWNKNSAHNIIINPIDQLADVYIKLSHDKDTRQAVISLYNPMFDNSKYTIDEQGKDICCLTGDMGIMTQDGSITIKDLVEKFERKEYLPLVYSFNTDTCQKELKPILAGALTRKNAKILQITLADTTVLKLTGDHVVYTMPGLIQKHADSLKEGDFLLNLYPCLPIKITKIEYLEEPEDVYDLTIEGNHNFFANGFLVHNCNLVLTFKIRDNKLHMTVFNRSNDIHWGLFGANLCQFTTIQEALFAGLKSVYLDLKIGTYTHITDSLHMYTKDYSGELKLSNSVPDTLYFDTEPRMSASLAELNDIIVYFWGEVNQFLQDTEFMLNSYIVKTELLPRIEKIQDNYWLVASAAMVAYRLIKLGQLKLALYVIDTYIPNCQWKVSMLIFIRQKIMKEQVRYPELIESYNNMLNAIIQDEPHVTSIELFLPIEK